MSFYVSGELFYSSSISSADAYMTFTNRLSLGASPIEYSEVDFLTPVEPMRPYKVCSGMVAQYYTKGPHRARYPPDVSVHYSITPWLIVVFRSVANSLRAFKPKISKQKTTPTTHS